jgi:site-specific DNA-methyltransferase (adenine-specific)
VVFRKPFPGTVVDNVLRYGTGALNIDGCRVKHSSKKDFEEHKAQVEAVRAKGGVRDGSWKNASDLSGASEVTEAGRWPSNATLTHAEGCKIVGFQKVNAPVINRFDDGAKPFGDGAGHSYTSTQTGDAEGKEEVPIWGCAEGCPVKELDGQSGISKSSGGSTPGVSGRMGYNHGADGSNVGSTAGGFGDSGGASRFFEQFQAPDSPFKYTAKPSKRETSLDGEIENDHVTKKPLELMRWLIRLVTFKGAHVLDPYCGSGTTLHAAAEEGVTYTGIENDPHYYEISVHRMDIVSGREQERQHQMSAFDLAMELGDEDS